MILTTKQKEGLKAGGILLAVVVAAVVYMDIMFWRPDLTATQKKIETARADVKTMESRIREIDREMANIDLLKQKQDLLKRISAKLPDSVDAPGFYNALVKILQVTRIDYSELEPLAPQERSAYVEIPYRITCKGRFHDFGQFLNLIEENPNRFMRVKSFTVENQKERPSIHPLSVEIGTFMFTRR